MKKTSLLLVFVILLITLLITRVSAIDMNLINSIRQNEINTAENLTTTNNTGNPFDENSIENTMLDTPGQNTNTPSASVNTITPSANEGLGIGEIIDILLIVVGVLIILLGIAILIRTNK